MQRCGFGFLFELLDDYYPSPNTGLVACDRNGRILAAGRGVFELTGYREHELMGKDVVEAFGLEGHEDGKSPIASRSNGACVGSASSSSSLARRPDQAGHGGHLPRLRRGGGLLVALPSPRRAREAHRPPLARPRRVWARQPGRLPDVLGGGARPLAPRETRARAGAKLGLRRGEDDDRVPLGAAPVRRAGGRLGDSSASERRASPRG